MSTSDPTGLGPALAGGSIRAGHAGQRRELLASEVAAAREPDPGAVRRARALTAAAPAPPTAPPSAWRAERHALRGRRHVAGARGAAGPGRAPAAAGGERAAAQGERSRAASRRCCRRRRASRSPVTLAPRTVGGDRRRSRRCPRPDTRRPPVARRPAPPLPGGGAVGAVITDGERALASLSLAGLPGARAVPPPPGRRLPAAPTSPASPAPVAAAVRAQRRRRSPAPAPLDRRPASSTRTRSSATSRSCSERVHGKPLVWLDNAATTQKPQAVIDRLVVLLRARELEHPPRRAHAGGARDRRLRRRRATRCAAS